MRMLPGFQIAVYNATVVGVLKGVGDGCADLSGLSPFGASKLTVDVIDDIVSAHPQRDQQQAEDAARSRERDTQLAVIHGLHRYANVWDR